MVVDRRVTGSKLLLGWVVLAVPLQEEGGDLGARTEADRAILEAADEIQENLAELRGLPFLHPVPRKILSSAEIGEYFRDYLQEEENLQAVRDEEVLYRAFGILSADVDYLELMGNLLEVGVGGFYDPDTKSLYCLSGATKFLNTFVMVHETYHSLQDQYFDLNAFVLHADVSMDAELGLGALVEGEAQFATTRYLEKYAAAAAEELLETDPKDMVGLLVQQLSAMSAPPFLLDLMTWPYTQGMVFVGELYDAGGWERVAAAYTEDPPASSEEVIHPEKYLSGDDPPVKIEFAVPAKLLASGYGVRTEEVLGELVTQTLIRHLSYDIGHALRGSQGWEGDRAVVLEGPSGQGLLLWKTEWETEGDAQEFYRAWRRSLQRQLELAAPLEQASTLQVVEGTGAAVPEGAGWWRAAEGLPLPDDVTACRLDRPDQTPSWVLRRGRTVVALRGEPLREEQTFGIALEILAPGDE